MWSAIRSVSARTAARFGTSLFSRFVADRHEIASRERLAEDDRHARAKRGLAIEVEADGHERDRRALALGRERHARRARPERLEPAGRVADPFGKDADRVAGGERGRHRRERLGVLRRIDALIDPAIDGDGAGAREDEPNGPWKSVDLARNRTSRPAVAHTSGGIEQRVRDGWAGAARRHARAPRRSDRSGRRSSRRPSPASGPTGWHACPCQASARLGLPRRAPARLRHPRRSASRRRRRRSPARRGWRSGSRPVASTIAAKTSGTEDAGIAFEHAEEREELRRLVPRDHAGEERPAERLRAALHHADQDRERVEVRRAWS